MTGKKAIAADRVSRIVELLNEAKTGDYEAVSAKLLEARNLFHTQIAECLTPSLNQRLDKSQRDTLQDKQELAKWVNSELRSHGVAIRCPKTGKPAFLRGDHGHDDGHGRFQLTLIGGDLNHRRTVSSPELFHIDLLGHYVRREPLAEMWADKLNRPGVTSNQHRK